MKAYVTVAMLLLATAVYAGDVYKTSDQKGQPVYTDKPPTLPAEKLDVRSSTTDVVEVQERYDNQMKRYSESEKASTDAASAVTNTNKARALTAEDRAKRCQDARQRYESYMIARRLYEPGGAEGERRYLTDAEIDAARTSAKQTMDEFCSGL